MCETHDIGCDHPRCNSLVRVDLAKDTCGDCGGHYCQMHLVAVRGENRKRLCIGCATEWANEHVTRPYVADE